MIPKRSSIRVLERWELFGLDENNFKDFKGKTGMRKNGSVDADTQYELPKKTENIGLFQKSVF